MPKTHPLNKKMNCKKHWDNARIQNKLDYTINSKISKYTIKHHFDNLKNSNKIIKNKIINSNKYKEKLKTVLYLEVDRIVKLKQIKKIDFFFFWKG